MMEPRRAGRPLALAAAAALLLAALVGCDDQNEHKVKRCDYALADAERMVKAQDLKRAREEQALAAKVCPPARQERVAALDKRLTALEGNLKELRKEQDRKEAAKAAAEKRKKHGKPPVIGEHSAKVGATGDCKTYVDCLCGLADAYRYETGNDAHRESCEQAKKVLSRRKQGCDALLKELAEQDDEWKAPYESVGIQIPSACP